MAAFTSSGSGNWSNAATWGGAGVPGAGDTVNIGAHTVTVDQTTIIGTSPNNQTTKVIDITSGSGVLVVNASLTIRGNLGMVSGSTLTLGAGGSMLWDASAAGGGAGLPIYKIVNAGFCKLNINGTSGSRCAMSAPATYSFSLDQNYTQLQINYCDFTRVAASIFVAASGTSVNIANNTFTSCGLLELQSFATNQDFIFNYNRFDNSGANSFKLTLDTVPTAGIRELVGNSFDSAFTYGSFGVVGRSNYFGGGVDGVGTHTWKEFRLNFTLGTRADGQLFEGLIERNYFTSNGPGNPHFIECRTSTVDCVFSQNIIESHDPDEIDYGDVLIPIEDRFTPPFIWIVKNNIVLRNSTAPVSTGTLVTYYNTNSDIVMEFYRNTANVDNPTANLLAHRAAIGTSEAGPGAPGNVGALKSNLVWGTSAGQGYLAERTNAHTPIEFDVIDPANADYNWTHNLSPANNQRGYHDQMSGAPLFTAGDAIAAGADVHQGTGDPQFYDRTRNLASWAAERGYGSTYADGLAAVRSDPLRIADLITYVFEGFRPSNPAARNAAHDGGCVGAANFFKASRTFSEVAAHRAALSKFGL